MSIKKIMPGTLFTYEGLFSHFNKIGKISPAIFEENTSLDDYIEVSSRDFLAALQRMILNNTILHSKPRIIHSGYGSINILDNIDYNKLLNTKIPRKISDFLIYYYEDPYQTHQKAKNENFHTDGRRFISEEIIAALNFSLRDFNSEVRMAAITTLGQIGAPETLLALDGILQCTKDTDIEIVTKALWVLARIAFACDNSIIPLIIDTLNSKYWKIKIASMFLLGKIGERCAKLALPILLKMLHNSAINRNLISDTIVLLFLFNKDKTWHRRRK